MISNHNDIDTKSRNAATFTTKKREKYMPTDTQVTVNGALSFGPCRLFLTTQGHYIKYSQSENTGQFGNLNLKCLKLVASL